MQGYAAFQYKVKEGGDGANVELMQGSSEFAHQFRTGIRDML